MSLIKCPECENKISDRASVCPNCGCPVPTVTYCVNCGNRIDNSNFCPICGVPVNAPYNSTATQYNYGVVHNSKRMCDTALVSGIMGLISLLLLFPIFAIISLVLGTSSLGKIKNENLDGKGWAVCGIVTSILSILICIFFIAILILFYDKF